MRFRPRRPEPLGRAFTALWFGEGVSLLGSQVTVLALPLIAITSLGAGTIAVGALYACSFLPYLLVGLQAGAVVDRLDRRSVMIVCDVVSAAALLSVPLLWWAGVRSVGPLVAVAFLTGCCGIFFEVANTARLPSLVRPDRLMVANARMETTRAAALVVGPGLGGLLVRALGAPAAVTVDAVTFLVSGAALLAVPAALPRARSAPDGPAPDGPAPGGPAPGGPAPPGRAPAPPRPPLRRDIAEGLRFVRRHDLLRPTVASYAASVLFIGMYQAMVILFMVRSAGLRGAAIGLVLGLGNLGFVAGATLARRLGARIGVGWAIVASLGLIAAGFLVSSAATSWWAVPCLVAGQFVSSLGTPVYNVTFISLRQTVTPPELLGRVTAVCRTLGRGLVPLGALAGAWIAATAGSRTVLVVAGLGGLAALVPVVFSAVPGVRTLDQVRPAAPSPPAGARRPSSVPG